MPYYDANRCCDFRDGFLSLMVQEEMIAFEERHVEALRMRPKSLSAETGNAQNNFVASDKPET